MPQLRRVVLRLTSGCALAAAAPGPSQVAMIHPIAVTNCNIDMESLIADPNRSIATLVRARGGLCLAGRTGRWWRSPLGRPSWQVAL